MQYYTDISVAHRERRKAIVLFLREREAIREWLKTTEEEWSACPPGEQDKREELPRRMRPQAGELAERDQIAAEQCERLLEEIRRVQVRAERHWTGWACSVRHCGGRQR